MAFFLAHLVLIACDFCFGNDRKFEKTFERLQKSMDSLEKRVNSIQKASKVLKYEEVYFVYILIIRGMYKQWTQGPGEGSMAIF